MDRGITTYSKNGNPILDLGDLPPLQNGQTLNISGEIMLTEVNGSNTAQWMISPRYVPTTTALPEGTVLPSGHWHYDPLPKPEPTILKCDYCETPFERRDAAGKLAQSCELCGAPLPTEVKKKKKIGKVEYLLAQVAEEADRSQRKFVRAYAMQIGKEKAMEERKERILSFAFWLILALAVSGAVLFAVAVKPP